MRVTCKHCGLRYYAEYFASCPRCGRVYGRSVLGDIALAVVLFGVGLAVARAGWWVGLAVYGLLK